MGDRAAVAELVARQAIVRDLTLREIDETARTATFVAATETGVYTWTGLEYLDMDGLDLSRYEANPVVVDAHRRDECDRVVGSAELSVEGRLLVCKVTYATTPRAENIWTLVKGKFLRAMSVSYFRLKVLQVEDGETETLGDQEITGPAEIVRAWELFEISNVPVGADPEALLRAMLGGPLSPEMQSALRLLVAPVGQGGDDMKDKKGQEKPEDRAPAAPPAENADGVGETSAAAAVEARALEALRRDVMAICPRGLEDKVDELMLKPGMDLEQAREALKQALAERQKPAGTDDADPVGEAAAGRAEREGGGKKLSDADKEDVKRSIFAG